MIDVQIGEKIYYIRNNVNEITISEFINYQIEAKECEKLQKKMEDGDESAGVKLLERSINQITYISDIPKEVLLDDMEYDQVFDLIGQIKFETQETKPVVHFEFRDGTDEEIAEKKLELKNTSKKEWSRRSKLKREIAAMESSKFFIIQDYGNNTAGAVIEGEAIRKKIHELGQKVNDGQFQYIPKIVAILARPAGEKWDTTGETVDRREKLFQDLPLGIAFNIASFFLLSLKIFSNVSKIASVHKQRANTLRLPQNSNFLKTGVGGS